MKAYRTHRADRVHLDANCPVPDMHGHRIKPLLEIDLDRVKASSFCHTCCPPEMWSVPKTLHTTCTICGHKKPFPCPHNGGVAVVDVSEPNGKRRVATRWRWPENVRDAPIAQKVIAD